MSYKLLFSSCSAEHNLVRYSLYTRSHGLNMSAFLETEAIDDGNNSMSENIFSSDSEGEYSDEIPLQSGQHTKGAKRLRVVLSSDSEDKVLKKT